MFLRSVCAVIVPAFMLCAHASSNTAMGAITGTTSATVVSTTPQVTVFEAASPETSSTLGSAALVSTATVSAAPPTTAAVNPIYRVNYDTVAPDQDATSEPLDAVAAPSADTVWRDNLASASIADNYREAANATFITYDDLAEKRRTVTIPYVPTTASPLAANTRFRPTGSLNGSIIYCSAGHGWTNDNTSTSLWYTQRPETNGMVEDFGNLDQLNFFADLCFRAGATIVPMRPLGFQHIERVIDNDTPQAGFQGEWANSSSDVSFGFDNSTIPYRFAKAAIRETAVARFRPVFPEDGFYPVYTWVRDGADRVSQTYRIVHAGAITEVDVDHRKVGKGWVYLGQYFFREGNSGYAEVTNQVRNAGDAGGVVVADAIRFGNGMGDINRGGGISRRPREEEANRYWTESSIAKSVPPIYLGMPDRNDQSNNVGAAPRLAAHMNRESVGNFSDRVFISFHSNAVGGRGVMGLFNAHAQMRPDHQIEFSKLVAEEVNASMTSAGLSLSKEWITRARLTQAHINFGEIRRDYINNEMTATILETAFHDDPEDAALMRQPDVRDAMSRASMRAILRYFRDTTQTTGSYGLPPTTPQFHSARADATTGAVVLRWEPGEGDPVSSPVVNLRYRVNYSIDGIVFDQGREVGNATTYTYSGLPVGTRAYFRIVALSDDGESLPTPTYVVSVGGGPKALLVYGDGLSSDEDVLTRTETLDLGAPLRGGGRFVRLVPAIMSNDLIAQGAGRGCGMLNLGIETISADYWDSATDIPSSYSAVLWFNGRSPVCGNMITTGTLTSLTDYLSSGGRLLISGANIAVCADESTGALQRWGSFVEKQLMTAFAPAAPARSIVKTSGNDLTTVTLQLGNRQLRYFDPRPVETLLALNAARPVLAYGDSLNAAAVGTMHEKLIRTAIVGFPVEELASPVDQAVLVAQILKAMGVEAPAPKKK